MRSSLLTLSTTVLAIVLLAGDASTQGTASGTLSGTVRDPNGSAVATALVRITNVQTGALSEATTARNGTYTMTAPAGTYDLVVPEGGFMFARFEQKGVVIGAASPTRADIALQWGGNLGTPGDDISFLIRSKGAPKGPTPRTREGKPDFSGVWLGSKDPSAGEPELLPWAQALVKQRLANNVKNHPSGMCLPGDVVPLNSPLLRKIIQTPSVIVRLTDGDVPGAQQVFVNGRHPRQMDPSWLGHSVARWEGDVLVVETVGFNDRSWLDVYPHTEQLRVVERWRRPDLGHLEMQFTLEDPGTFVKPWTVRNVWDLAPGEELYEYVCENNRDGAFLATP